MKDYYGWRARIGLIYPAEGLVIEPEFHAMAPEGVSVHPTRIDLSNATLEGLSAMMDDDRIDVAARLYGRAPLQVLTFGGTSATFMRGMGYDREVDVLGYASQKGMFTKAFCTTPDEALAMAEAGVDNIIVHYGNSSGGTIGSETVMEVGQAVERTVSVLDALAAKHGDLIFTCHGGAIETPEDFTEFLVKEPRLHGYVGGSSAERFPIEESVPKATQGFKAVILPKTK